jgi:hypothetical protein
MWASISFLYTSNEKSKEEIEKHTKAPEKNMKYLPSNLANCAMSVFWDTGKQ